VSDFALIRLLTAAFGGLLVLPATALAADGEGTRLNLKDAAPKAVADHGGSGAATIVRTIVGLAVVLAVIYGITWVLRQVKTSRDQGSTGTGLEPIASLQLGPNRSLHLIRAGQEVVLVGAGDHGVVPVRTYTEREAIELGLLPEDAPDGDDDQSSGGSGGSGGSGSGSASGSRRGGLLPRPRRDWLNQLRARTVIK
jgi:flagellar protein FliO/FliZ